MTFQIIMNKFCSQENNVNISAWIIFNKLLPTAASWVQEKQYLAKICLRELDSSLATSLCLVNISEMT